MDRQIVLRAWYPVDADVDPETLSRILEADGARYLEVTAKSAGSLAASFILEQVPTSPEAHRLAQTMVREALGAAGAPNPDRCQIRVGVVSETPHRVP